MSMWHAAQMTIRVSKQQIYFYSDISWKDYTYHNYGKITPHFLLDYINYNKCCDVHYNNNY